MVNARIVGPPDNLGIKQKRLALFIEVDGVWTEFGSPVYFESDAGLPNLALEETTAEGSALWFDAPPGPIKVVFDVEGEHPCEPMQGWHDDHPNTLRAEVRAGTITEMEARCPPVPVAELGK